MLGLGVQVEVVFFRELLLLLVASVVSDSVGPHRWQPTRLPHPWDFPGKNWSGLPFPSPMHESEK